MAQRNLPRAAKKKTNTPFKESAPQQSHDHRSVAVPRREARDVLMRRSAEAHVENGAELEGAVDAIGLQNQFRTFLDRSLATWHFVERVIQPLNRTAAQEFSSHETTPVRLPHCS
jgi:hypothetical protein